MAGMDSVQINSELNYCNQFFLLLGGGLDNGGSSFPFDKSKKHKSYFCHILHFDCTFPGHCERIGCAGTKSLFIRFAAINGKSLHGLR
jgi:hypothetical protein